jgi:ADP-heptose:LPS heptosyltransferase
MSKKLIIFTINGKVEDHIIATAVCSGIKKKYNDWDLLVVSSFPEIFTNNPNIFLNLHINNSSNLYADYIKNNECLIFSQHPSQHLDYYKNNKSLTQMWFELLDIPYNNETPEIYFNKVEKEYYFNLLSFNKPILVIQHSKIKQNSNLYNWTEEFPPLLTQQIFNTYKEKYSIINAHIPGSPQHPDISNVDISNIKVLIALLMVSEKRIFCNGIMQHLAAALKLPSVVLWINSNPTVFGYKLHTNLQSNPYTKDTISFNPPLYTPYNNEESLNSFPYNDFDEVFDFYKVRLAIDKQVR